jgi:hypothetical protein
MGGTEDFSEFDAFCRITLIEEGDIRLPQK